MSLRNRLVGQLDHVRTSCGETAEWTKCQREPAVPFPRTSSMATCGDHVLKPSSSRARTKCAARARRGPGQVVMARWSSLLLLHTTLHWGQPQRRSESKAPMSPVEQPALLPVTACRSRGRVGQRERPPKQGDGAPQWHTVRSQAAIWCSAHFRGSPAQ